MDKTVPIDTLLEQTFSFAKASRSLILDLPQTPANQNDGRQLITTSGALAAHYIEASEEPHPDKSALLMKTCIKDAKQSHLWLSLLDCGKDTNRQDLRNKLLEESEDIQLALASLIQDKASQT
ncbi:MAG: hypothetical protein AAGA18_06150 [Verrucomicrobiota bacterium]